MRCDTTLNRRPRTRAKFNLWNFSGCGVIPAKHAAYLGMNTYFFTAEVSVRRTVEVPGPHGPDHTFEENQSKPCLIIRGDNPEQAQKFFEDRIIQGYEDESSSEVEITRILAAQFVDQLFTESGGIPFDWPQINADVNAYVYETAVDDYEQGYW